MKGKNTIKETWWLVLKAVTIGILLIGASFSSALGLQPIDETERHSASSTTGVTSEWPLEVGVEFVSDYPYCCRSTPQGTICGWDVCDLPCADNNGWDVYNRLRSRGWCSENWNDCFIVGNSSAWEEDFKRHDLGGTNNDWVDDVDLVFYEGHGNPNLFTFETWSGPGTHDDSYLTYNDARLAWGDNDLEWMALLSCSVLADSHEVDWVWTMNGLHLLMGFQTTAYDSCGFGEAFANYASSIFPFYSISTAWFKACDSYQPSGVTAKVLAEELNHFSDTWYYQYPDAWDYYYHRRTHNCGARFAGGGLTYAQVQENGGIMPVFKTPALSLEEAQTEWQSLTTAFEIPTQTVDLLQLEGDDYWVSVSEGRELEMDTANGLYYYLDHNRLFTTSTTSQIHALSNNEAKIIADQFLNANDLMPNDAQFTEVFSETVETVAMPGRVLGRFFDLDLNATTVVEETVTDYQVTYSRILTYTTTAERGNTTIQQVTSVPVVGPGAKLKVYVSAAGGSSQVATSSGTGAVVGAKGGWRRTTETPGLHAMRQGVRILSYDQIEQLFMELEPQVALEQVPFGNTTDKEILNYHLGYWEEPTGAGQDELYPAYVLNARYTGEYAVTPGVTETVVVTDYTYFPANETYMRPLAKIESLSDLSPSFMPGQVITATAADASKTLAELGYHPSLTFTLGSGVLYTYDWYLGSIADENAIGTGRDLVYTITVPTEVGRAIPMPQTVILKVTDIGSQHSAQNSSSASMHFDLVPPVFLPMMLKDR